MSRLVRDAGMSTRASEVHPRKAEPAMVVRLEQTDRSTETSDVQFWQAFLPIVDKGMFGAKARVASAAQPLKAFSPNVASNGQRDRSADGINAQP